MAKVLLVADGIFHPPMLAWRHVRRVLLGMPDIELTLIRHLNYLKDLDVSGYQAMVLYYHHKQIERESLELFDRFVQDGGGVLAVHSATASFKDRPRYFEILGGRFSGHGPVESFDIEPAAEAVEIFEGVGAFTVHDELYLHELQPDLQIHFSAQYQGDMQPMVWTHTVGDGRVCTLCPGHRTATMKQPQMEELMRRGLAWVVAEERDQ